MTPLTSSVRLILALLCLSALPTLSRSQYVRFPTAPLQAPISSINGTMPFYLVAAPQSASPTAPLLYLWQSDYEELYSVNSTGLTVQSTSNTSGLLLEYFETRPHNGVVWALAVPSFYSTSPHLLCYNATSLQLLHSFPFPALHPLSNYTSGFTFIATDNSGVVYVSQGGSIYSISPTTGLQVGFISLAASTTLESPDLEFSQGYYIGFDPIDVLWVVDGNSLNGSHTVWRANTNGSILSFGFVALPFASTQQLQSFAVDSAGYGWVSIYGSDATNRLLYRIDPHLNVTTFSFPGLTTLGATDVELSISWGANPSLDLVFVYDYSRLPVWAMRINGTLSFALQTTPADLDVADMITYDAYLDSFLVANLNGYYAAIRVSQTGTFIEGWDLGLIDYDFFNSYLYILYSIQGDGHGLVLMSGLTADLNSGQLWLYNGSSLVWTIVEGNGAATWDTSARLIYTPSLADSTVIEIYSYQGVKLDTLNAPAAFSYDFFILFVTSGSTRGLAVCDFSDAGSIQRIDVATGAVSTLFRVNTTGLGVYSFVYSPDGAVLYVLVGPTATGNDPFNPPLNLLAVNVATGRVITEMGDGKRGFEAVGVNPQGLVWAASENSLSTFAQPALSLASVNGDPAFVGLRGQQFQVHGVPGSVYSIVSSAHIQLNARFDFLTSGTCPNIPHPGACFSHPGTYFSELSIQTRGAQRVLITAGTASKGFTRVELNGTALNLDGEPGGGHREHVSGDLTVTVMHRWQVVIVTGLWKLVFDNSDRFINLAEVSVSDWHRLIQSEQPHGLLGQTWEEREMKTVTDRAPIDGVVDDYCVPEGNIWGVETLFNKFHIHDAASD